MSTAPTTPPTNQTTAWPGGCRKPGTCERKRACSYVPCRHRGRTIASEVDAAIQALQVAVPIHPRLALSRSALEVAAGAVADELAWSDTVAETRENASEIAYRAIAAYRRASGETA